MRSRSWLLHNGDCCSKGEGGYNLPVSRCVDSKLWCGQ